MSEASNQNELAGPGEQHLVQILAEEHPDSPWDDRRLSSLLGNRGIPLGPRSVGRYRQRLDIPSSSDRRRWDPATRQRELKRLRALVRLNGNDPPGGPRDPATEDTGPLPAVRLPPPPEPEDLEPVLFSSEPEPSEASRLEEVRKLLSSTDPALLSGERTLSNIPAILRELLTPTAASSGGSRLQIPGPAVPSAPAQRQPNPALEEPPGDALSEWKPYLEFHWEDRSSPASSPDASELRDEWRELSPQKLQSIDLDAERAEEGAILDRLFPGPDSSSPGVKSSEPAGSELFLFLDEEDPGQPPPPQAQPRPQARTPQPPRAKGTPGRTPQSDLEDTQPERTPGLPRSSDSKSGRQEIEGTQRNWSELWPFPKYRQLVEDVPVLARLKLRRSTFLLRPVLASRLRDAHRAYLGGEPELAASILESLIPSRSSSIRFWAHLLLGELRLVHGARLTEARTHLTEAVHMSSRTGRAHLLLAITLYLQDELDAACELLQSSRNAASPSPTARLVLGLTLLELGELTRGLAELEAARKRFQFPQELQERLRHARELLKAGLWSPNRGKGPTDR